MVELALIVLAVLYLCGLNVGKALAICSIISVVLNTALTLIKNRLDN